LIVIDMQKGLVQAAWESARLLQTHQTLLDWAQARNMPLIYMQHDGKPDSTVPVGTDAWRLHPDVLRPGAKVIRKTASDAFYKTTLAETLAELDVTNLILTGIKSERCVDTTARAAVSRGYDVLLVADAHSTLETPVLPASQIIRFTNHNLQGFGNDSATIDVLTSHDLLHGPQAE
ncbi:MAG TPA: isochorismatase family protein, partial [Candidatus Obscuribacterales bacterium]